MARTNPQSVNGPRRSGRSLRIAMIGPAPCPETGTSILFKILLDWMPSHGVVVHTIPIPIGGVGAATKLRKLLGVLIKAIHVAPRVDVISVHVPTLQLSNLAVALLIVAKVFRRDFVLRKFGGTDLNDLGRGARVLARWVIRNSDVVFVEARKQCDDIREALSTEVLWYPNHRSTRPRPPERDGAATRFVYLGRVREEKGIWQIAEAAAVLAGRCSVDIYGPYENGFDWDLLDRCPYVHYRGVLDHGRIASVLSEYDGLLLPTYWQGEGYPGVIIEAFHAGVPVIATRWKFIPEIVDETCGILVTPRDTEELIQAMGRFIRDREWVQCLRAGALARSKAFSLDRWADLFVTACHIAHEHSGDRDEMFQQIRSLYTPSHPDVSDSAWGPCDIDVSVKALSL